jgi:alpha-ketoglutarate-dependent taurine dioxygenase
MKKILPNKFIMTKHASEEDVYKFLRESLSLDDWYVNVFELDKALNDNCLNNISKILNLEIMKYNGFNYVDFKDVYYENEFHFDGITSPNLSRAPKVLGFQCLQNHTQVGGEMKLLNCEEILKKLNKDVYKILKNTVVNYYGMSSYFNKNPKFDELVFSINPITTRNDSEYLRLHIPTQNKEMRKITKLGIYSFNDDYTCCLDKCSAEESIEIFDHLSEVSFHKDVTYKFKILPYMFVLVNNNAVFHGRDKLLRPEKRLLRRIQFI